MSNTLQVYVKYVKYFGNLCSPIELVQMHTCATRHPRERVVPPLLKMESRSRHSPTHLSLILVLLALQAPAAIRCVPRYKKDEISIANIYLHYAEMAFFRFQVILARSCGLLSPDRTCPFGIWVYAIEVALCGILGHRALTTLDLTTLRRYSSSLSRA